VVDSSSRAALACCLRTGSGSSALTSPIASSPARVAASSRVHASRSAGGRPARQGVAGLGEPLGDLGPEQRPGPPGGPVDQLGDQLGLGRRGDPVGQFVGLVDDEQLVRWHDVPAGEHVDGEQAVVGDHDVRLAGPGPGRLREALLPERAAGRADALPGRHRDGPPELVVDPRVQFVPVTGGGLLRPVADPLDLLAQPAGLAEPPGAAGSGRVEEGVLRLLLGRAVQPGQAEVVVPALQHGEGRAAAEQRLHRVGQPGQVVLDQLGLQGQGGRGDHHRPVHGQRRGQVGQRLAGARAGLHQQVLAGGDALLDRLGHLLLAGTGGAAGDRADRRGEQVPAAGPGAPALLSDGGTGGGAERGHRATVPAVPDTARPGRARRAAAQVAPGYPSIAWRARNRLGCQSCRATWSA
jgi:hypothetical protein